MMRCVGDWPERKKTPQHDISHSAKKITRTAASNQLGLGVLEALCFRSRAHDAHQLLYHYCRRERLAEDVITVQFQRLVQLASSKHRALITHKPL
ncbi:hypothetical protein M9H77_31908 [Catharanthus roseus]|uniref:Uncharacterized protein n=1 Tax=Catharanthus roseus TaxID=4058 RepID=A0ACC0A5A4_CATRO|nr:hypothetical protein M9H77_31908 [Catharanthus roseus]